MGIGLGAITAAGGLGGTAVGGVLAQRWLKTNKDALFLVSAWSALLTVPPAVLCFFGPKVTILPSLAVAMFLDLPGDRTAERGDHQRGSGGGAGERDCNRALPDPRCWGIRLRRS